MTISEPSISLVLASDRANTAAVDVELRRKALVCRVGETQSFSWMRCSNAEQMLQRYLSALTSFIRIPT